MRIDLDAPAGTMTTAGVDRELELEEDLDLVLGDPDAQLPCRWICGAL